MIARRFLLFVALVVLLIHYDQPDVPHGREDAGACRHNHSGFARPDATPFLGALGIVERGVENRHPLSESLVKLAGDGGRQGDLRDQHQRAACQAASVASIAHR